MKNEEEKMEFFILSCYEIHFWYRAEVLWGTFLLQEVLLLFNDTKFIKIEALVEK